MTREEIHLRVGNHGTCQRGVFSDMRCQIPARPTVNYLPVLLEDVWRSANNGQTGRTERVRVWWTGLR